jgi:multidrug efflux pump subunit AcrB
LRHPITVMVATVAITLGSVFAVLRMRTDVFPDLNMPVIYVAQAYGGMDSAQMEGLITNYYEYAFLYMSGIDHVETKNIQNIALVKLVFHPGTDMAQAMAEAAIFANRAKAYLPPGTVTPFILRLDASSVPVSFLVLSSKTRSISELSDLMLFRVRPILASIPGASAPQPFGGSLRTIVVYLDPERLRAYNLSPQEVADALNKGNTITPSGNARVRDQMPVVSVNSLVTDPKDLGNIPIKPEQSIYLRDLGRVEDASDIPTGWALVNGRRSIYMPVVKTADASTLTVVNDLKANLGRMQSVIPDDVKLTLEFDQSPYVTGAIGGVVEESALGAILTGLMVLLFLRDWRSVIVVVLTIPLALMGAVFGLWLVGQTINLMTLGGLSLAVGILVDEATVVIENIHTQMGKHSSIPRAIQVGTAETLVPNMLAMLCILAVFLPSFLMEGATRGLFVPLAIGVGFAMIFAFILSITFVPVISMWLLRHVHATHEGRIDTEHARPPWLVTRLLPSGLIGPALELAIHRPIRFVLRRLPGGHQGPADRFTFERFKGRYSLILRRSLDYRRTVIPAYIVGSLLVLGLVGTQVGREIAPTVDAGQFQMRIRAPSGTSLEMSEQITRRALEVIKEIVGGQNIDISVAYVGVTAPTYTVNAIYLWTGGTDQAVVRIALRHGSGLSVAKIRDRLRQELPRKLEPWLQKQLQAMGYAPEQALARAATMHFSFEPADVVNQVMTFGSPTPIEVVISGPRLADNRAYAEKVRAEMAKIPSLRDLQFGQVMDYPRIKIDVDRERAGLAGVTLSEASTAMIAATSSSRYVVPVFWADPKSGIGYQVQLEVPPARMDSHEEVGMIPVKRMEDGRQLLLRDIANIESSIMPEEYDRLNQMRYVSLTANVAGEDLGRVTNRLEKALKTAGEPPRGVRVELRGQVAPMLQMFRGLTIGLGLAVVVIFLLLAAYFQSVRLAIVAVATSPAVIAGVAVALYFTNTTLNIESFMGAIMAIGVAVANAILLVTFAERHRREKTLQLEGAPFPAAHEGEPIPSTHSTGMSPAIEAAIHGARDRLRPILMTSCAMIAGMFPMALGLGEGGEQTAPLGRAVIGGLVAATFATLLVLPSFFSVALSKSSARSSSLDPDDPDSRNYDQRNDDSPDDGLNDTPAIVGPMVSGAHSSAGPQLGPQIG